MFCLYTDSKILKISKQNLHYYDQINIFSFQSQLTCYNYISFSALPMFTYPLPSKENLQTNSLFLYLNCSRSASFQLAPYSGHGFCVSFLFSWILWLTLFPLVGSVNMCLLQYIPSTVWLLNQYFSCLETILFFLLKHAYIQF